MKPEKERVPGFTENRFTSELMQREMPHGLILPVDYFETEFSYPVLYLLHGLFGAFDNWAALTGLVEYAASYKMIVVTPEGGDGWYTDSETNAREKYESYLIDELIPLVDANYRTTSVREGRGIAGLSMGGYGALKFGLKYRDLFAMTASISGALDPAERSDVESGFDGENLRPSVMSVFGPPESRAREENDLYKLAAKLSAKKISELPRIYFDCGSSDGFLLANRHFSALLSEKSVAHEFQELPGEHDWAYWDQRVRHILRLAGETLI